MRSFQKLARRGHRAATVIAISMMTPPIALPPCDRNWAPPRVPETVPRSIRQRKPFRLREVLKDSRDARSTFSYSPTPMPNSPRLNGSKPTRASLCVGVIRLRGVTPPPRPIDRYRSIGRGIIRNRSGKVRGSQRAGDNPTDDRRSPPTAAPTTAMPTTTMPTTTMPTTTAPAAATMTLRLRCTDGANHDSRAQSDDSCFHLCNMSDAPEYNVNIWFRLVRCQQSACGRGARRPGLVAGEPRDPFMH